MLARFLSVGVLNMLVGMSTIYIAITYLDWSNVWANVAGYAAGLCVSYALNSKLTFKYRGSWQRALPRFLVVFLVAYLANLVVVLSLVHYTTMSDFLAHWLGIPVYTCLSYLGSRYFAFSGKAPGESAAQQEAK